MQKWTGQEGSCISVAGKILDREFAAMYRPFGFLELSEHPSMDNGVQNGMMIEKEFDYRRWNGTTAVCIPYEQLKSRLLDVDDEWAEWLLSDQPFVGGLDDSRQNGIFVLLLRVLQRKTILYGGKHGNKKKMAGRHAAHPVSGILRTGKGRTEKKHAASVS